MTLFDDAPARLTRSGADWEQHRRHRTPRSGPPLDEVGVPALASFVLARTPEVAVAVRGVTAFSDGLVLDVCVLFADEQRAEDVAWSLQDFNRSPGRFGLGVIFADGRKAVAGGKDAPEVARNGETPSLVLLGGASTPLGWSGAYWLWPLPAPGPLVIGCRWPDRGVSETLVQVDPAPLLDAAASSRPVWEQQ